MGPIRRWMGRARHSSRSTLGATTAWHGPNVMAQPIDQGADLWWSRQEDHAIMVKVMTRWNNYYVQGNLQMHSTSMASTSTRSRTTA